MEQSNLIWSILSCILFTLLTVEALENVCSSS